MSHLTRIILPIDLTHVAKESFNGDIINLSDDAYIYTLKERFEKFLQDKLISYRKLTDPDGPNVYYIIENYPENGYKEMFAEIANIKYPDHKFDEYHIELSYNI